MFESVVDEKAAEEVVFGLLTTLPKDEEHRLKHVFARHFMRGFKEAKRMVKEGCDEFIQKGEMTRSWEQYDYVPFIREKLDFFDKYILKPIKSLPYHKDQMKPEEYASELGCILGKYMGFMEFFVAGLEFTEQLEGNFCEMCSICISPKNTEFTKVLFGTEPPRPEVFDDSLRLKLNTKFMTYALRKIAKKKRGRISERRAKIIARMAADFYR